MPVIDFNAKGCRDDENYDFKSLCAMFCVNYSDAIDVAIEQCIIDADDDNKDFRINHHDAMICISICLYEYIDRYFQV